MVFKRSRFIVADHQGGAGVAKPWRGRKQLSTREKPRSSGCWGASYEDMAAWFGVSTRTIERRMASEKSGFCRAYKKGLGRLKVSLRRQQVELAKNGNPTMLIWLGKQLLKQRDKVDATNQVTVKESGPHKLTPEDEAFLKRKAGLMGVLRG